MSKTDPRNFEERYNSCFIDLAVKTGCGLLLGSMIGGFFLRGFNKWPMFICGGLGVGMAYTNCENSLNDYLLSLDPKICRTKKIAFICYLQVSALSEIFKTSTVAVWSTVKTLFLLPFYRTAGHFPQPFGALFPIERKMP